MNSAPYTTVLFDFDGTITPSLPLWIEASKYTFAQYNRDVDNRTIVEKCFYRSTEEIMSEFEISAPIEEFKKHLSIGLQHAFQHATLFDGVKIVLKQCQQLSLKLGLVTSSPRRVVNMVLVNLEIDQYFQATVTADDITNFKPHPEPILRALEQLKGAPQSTLIIGDTMHDIAAGHAAGIKTALFSPEHHERFHSFEQVISLEPHYIFKSYKEIATHLDLSSFNNHQYPQELGATTSS